jgi:hypothetical protein
MSTPAPAPCLERFLRGIEYTGYLVDFSTLLNADRSIFDAKKILIRHILSDSVRIWHARSAKDHIPYFCQAYQNITANFVSQFYMVQQFTEPSLSLSGSVFSLDSGTCQRPSSV